MTTTAPFVLTIAGFDPSGGAGILADTATVRALNVRAVAACTAITVQNGHSFERCEWTSPDLLLEQVRLMAETYPVRAVKIGIIRHIALVEKIARMLKAKNPEIKIVWDPVLKSSSGYDFHSSAHYHDIPGILEHIDFFTPNHDEILAISGNKVTDSSLRTLAGRCHLVLKGGHRSDRKGVDILYRKDQAPVEFSPEKILPSGRHGSGCVFSSALAAYLALGTPEAEACRLAKKHTYGYLSEYQAHTGKGRIGDMTLQYVSSGATPDEHLRHIETTCAAGVKWIQLRLKEQPEGVVYETACKALEICRAYGARLIVDDSVAVARATGADGVHLGKTDLPPGQARKILGENVIIGGTANTAEDIIRLAGQGVDYIGLGPYRFTTTKKNLSPVLGIEGYSKIAETLAHRGIRIPVIAIGGILEEDITPLLQTGVQGIAVSGMLTAPGNDQEKITGLVKSIENLKYVPEQQFAVVPGTRKHH
ncbi:thiamine phosphate synthase [Sinomicrobium soli]|uniref:thiamine phosphate synthase n=1 Tax=Sinomicrobium sp. N-1-3-6 TaxID=2219864 RepID=UPI001374D8DF|nr:thiamine phosphate synthase [Sinomicrobium sp. N-1-3-6]